MWLFLTQVLWMHILFWQLYLHSFLIHKFHFYIRYLNSIWQLNNLSDCPTLLKPTILAIVTRFISCSKINHRYFLIVYKNLASFFLNFIIQAAQVLSPYLYAMLKKLNLNAALIDNVFLFRADYHKENTFKTFNFIHLFYYVANISAWLIYRVLNV